MKLKEKVEQRSCYLKHIEGKKLYVICESVSKVNVTHHSNKCKVFKIIKGYFSKGLIFLSVWVSRGYI